VQVYNFPPIGRSPILLIGAVVVYSMPFMYRPVSNALQAIDALTLTEAGQILGANVYQVLSKIIVPNILPGILSGSLLVFSTVFAEYTLTSLIVGARFKTFPLLLVEYTRINGNIAAAFSVLSFTIAWLFSILILWAVVDATLLWARPDSGGCSPNRSVEVVSRPGALQFAPTRPHESRKSQHFPASLLRRRRSLRLGLRSANSAPWGLEALR
jgi:hypothetical protein